MAGKSGLTFQVLDGQNAHVLGEWQASGEGQETFDISGLTNRSLRLRANFYASGAETPSLASWTLLWAPNRAPAAPPGLSVDGQPAGYPGAMNITSRAPAFEWRFSDNDTGQTQGAFNLSVWSGPNGTGTLMWRLQKEGPESSATYGKGPVGQPLVPGLDYFVTVQTRDTPR